MFLYAETTIVLLWNKSMLCIKFQMVLKPCYAKMGNGKEKGINASSLYI